MPTFRKGRSRIVVIAVLAMVVSMLGLPAGAATGDVEWPADWSACPAGAVPSAGFGDTAGSFAEDDIDCIAMYEVTLGTGAGVYSPGAVVTREQMALFLARAAGPAGLTLPAVADQGFTDIAGLPQASQDAINQIAKLGVTKGTTATTYSPGDSVSRYQMALFLVRFLEAQNGTADLEDSEFASGFTDTGSVSFEGYNAIETAYDYGITKGTTKTLFSPFAAVTREQMAAFIGRTLAHTNAAPSGVTLQASATTGEESFDPEIKITARTADFAPDSFALVDLFWVTDQDDNPPLKSDGTCIADNTVSFNGFSDECDIDFGDLEVNALGNLVDDLSVLAASVPAGETYTLWAWTGDVGDEFDADTTQVSSISLSGTAVVDLDIEATDNVDDDAVALHFGDDVTITVQLIDETPDPDKDYAKAGEEIVIDWSEEVVIDGGFQSIQFFTTTVETDASGAATFTFSGADPDSADSEDPFEADYKTYVVSIDDADNPGTNTFVDVYMFTDEDPYVETFEVSTPTKYADNTTSAASVTVTATVLDQYADGISGETVRIYENNGVTTLGESTTRVTNSSGEAKFAFTADGTGGLIADFDACWDPDGDLPFDCDVSTAHIDFYFAEEAADGDSGTDYPVVVWDDGNDIAVVDAEGVPTWVMWDSGDQFHVNGSPVTQSNFEDAGGDTGWWLEWENYGHATNPAAFSLWD